MNLTTNSGVSPRGPFWQLERWRWRRCLRFTDGFSYCARIVPGAHKTQPVILLLYLSSSVLLVFALFFAVAQKCITHWMHCEGKQLWKQVLSIYVALISQQSTLSTYSSRRDNIMATSAPAVDKFLFQIGFCTFLSRYYGACASNRRLLVVD